MTNLNLTLCCCQKIKPKFDVLVAGAGVAGIASAIGAARSGAATVLVEKSNVVGGLATNGMVGTVCGLFHRTNSKRPHYVGGEFAREWGDRLMRQNSSRLLHLPDGLHAIAYHPLEFEELSESFLRETSNLTIYRNSMVSHAHVDNRTIKEVVISSSESAGTIEVSAIVDCTGDCCVFSLAGARSMLPENEQFGALICAISGADSTVFDPQRQLSIMVKVCKAVDRKQLPDTCRFLSFVPGPSDGSLPLYLKLNVPVIRCDYDNQKAKWESEIKTAMKQLLGHLQKEIAAFKHATIKQMSSHVGVRTSRRAVGVALLTESDVLNCNKQSDGVARGAWPVEQWLPGPRVIYSKLPQNDYYDIPFGCLKSRDIHNLFVAGRAISAEDAALASARVIGTCLDTGWAAGVAAANSSSLPAPDTAVDDQSMPSHSG